MNLARVEYHFSDLLSVLESGRDAQGWTQEWIEAMSATPPRVRAVRTMVVATQRQRAFDAEIPRTHRELAGPRGTALVEVPTTRRERARGLRRRAGLAPGTGLLLERCRSVHTIGMRFPIAVAFLDRDLMVLEVRRVPAGRLLRPRWRSRHVLELPIGADVRVGDRFSRSAARGPRTTPGARRTGRPPRT